MNIRTYQESDYDQLKNLYLQSTEFAFDEETDAPHRLAEKMRRDADSIIVMVDGEEIIGSVCLIEDGRIALLFRLVALPARDDQNEILRNLIKHAEGLAKERGYKELHNMAPAEGVGACTVREDAGFSKGNAYAWYWKTLD